MKNPPKSPNKGRQFKAVISIKPRTRRAPDEAGGTGQVAGAEPATVPPCPTAEAGPQPATCIPAPGIGQPATGERIPAVRLHAQRPWQAQHEAVVGLSHRNANPPMPCQDAAISLLRPHPLLIVADGAGSAALSELGAQAVVSGLARLVNTLDRQVASLLDETVNGPAMPDPEQARNFALLLVKHAKGILEDLANQHRRPVQDFRCTLLLILAGQQYALWLKVGDGALVYERRNRQADGSLQAELHTLGEPGKGEFANLTRFIDERLSPVDVQSGLLALCDISGLVAMSDGAAEKLIAQDGSRVARQLEHWLEALRQTGLARRDLTRSFYSDAFSVGSSGDDCSIALLASELCEIDGPAA